MAKKKQKRLEEGKAAVNKKDSKKLMKIMLEKRKNSTESTKKAGDGNIQMQRERQKHCMGWQGKFKEGQVI